MTREDNEQPADLPAADSASETGLRPGDGDASSAASVPGDGGASRAAGVPDNGDSSCGAGEPGNGDSSCGAGESDNGDSSCGAGVPDSSDPSGGGESKDEGTVGFARGGRRPVSVLAKAIAGLQEASRSGHERLLRTAAEFDNFKKRSRREVVDSARRAEEKVVLEFLPVLDNLERALSHTVGQEGPLLEGVRMVHKQFLGALEKLEIRPCAALGPE